MHRKSPPNVTPDISSWGELTALLPTLAQHKWLFRGESECDRELKAKAGRVGKHLGAERKIPFDPKHEAAILALFKRQARPYLNHTPANDLEWLAVAQHHGMHTRLLDWSESLLVAAYFAAKKAGVEGHALIYGVCDIPEVRAAEEKAPFGLKRVALYRPPHIAPRIPAQSSVFTVHPDPTVALTTPNLKKWVVADSACMQIKRMLDFCAINESTLFPDLDGLARHLGWRYKWGKLPA
jgi:hypothetical protein